MEANSNFWIIASAVKKFYMDHHVLPLPGSVPDMKAQSTIYVQLQSIYKAKARQDVSEVLETVQNHPKGKDIEPSEVENFCKNAAFIKLIRSVDSTTPVPDITAISSKASQFKGCLICLQLIDREFESDENAPMTLMPLSLIPIYLALNATSHIPTGSAIHASNIVENISNASPGLKLNTRVTEVAQEVARANGGELHNIAALTGGMVAQEAIKIITKQYIPIDNTCIFDGITSRTQILRI
jgi:amyloid beta precursor protein binding protein 1